MSRNDNSGCLGCAIILATILAVAFVAGLGFALGASLWR